MVYQELMQHTLQTAMSSDKHLRLSLKADSNVVLVQFVKDAIAEYNKFSEETSWQQKIYTMDEDLRWKSDISGFGKRNLDAVVLPEDTKSSLIEDFDFFIQNQAWYDQRNVPYHRTYLFSGPPGCGMQYYLYVTC